MFFKRYVSEGLAHFSYMIADQGKAVVIDPRRDVDAYLRDAQSGGFSIDYVLETHRNEDYVIGSLELEAATGAEIFHADSQWDYHYGTSAKDGQVWNVGRLKIQAMLTPGHTPGSISYLLNDSDGNLWMLFSGDTLFSGDAGRVDLLGEDMLQEMAGQLYDSIFDKILPLGDGVILCPAHGAGSACGSAISDRIWTTLGLERQYNPKLQVNSKQDFITLHATNLDRPPYFRKMEQLNLEGAAFLTRLPLLKPLQPTAFEQAMGQSQLVDTRDTEGFCAAHLPGSLAIQVDRLANFAGWFLNYDDPILFVVDPDRVEPLVRNLVRIGFDNIAGYLEGGLGAWSLSGKQMKSIKTITAQDLCVQMRSDIPSFLLDVRAGDELKDQGLKHGVQIPLTELLDNLSTVPKDRTVLPLCPRGNRSLLAASLLEREGWEDIALTLGGLGAWRAIKCDFEL